MIAEDPFGGGSIEPFDQCREHNSNLLRGGFQTIQGGVASGSESAVAGLTAKGLDALGLAVLANADKGMDVCIGDLVGRAPRVGTSESLSNNTFGCSSPAFHLAPGAH